MPTTRVAFDENLLPKDHPRIDMGAESTAAVRSTGLATFKNVTGGAVSVTVWFNNGNNGQSNAVLSYPNDTWQIWVQSGDTWSWAYGNQGVPVQNERYWINYGLNNVG